MNQIIQKFGMMVAMLLSFLSSSAYNFTTDGILYEILSLDNNTCQVIAKKAKYTGIISIPANVEFNGRTFKVVSISENAFLNCDGISELHLESAENLLKISASAFEGCTSIKEVTIPSNCKNLYHNAFFGCSSLKTVVISESSEPLVIQPKYSNGSISGTNLSYYFGQFADCPIEQLKILRDIQYGGDANEFKEIDYRKGRIMNVLYFPWISSCTSALTIGRMVTKIPYNLLLTLDPSDLIVEDTESAIDIEPLTTYKSYWQSPDVYGDYTIDKDGYIRIKVEDGCNNASKLFRGFKFPNLQYVYWGRPVKTSEFIYISSKPYDTSLRNISLESNYLTTFEFGKNLKEIGYFSSVSSSKLSTIIWNDCLLECKIFNSTPNISELKFPNSLQEISGFSSTGNLKEIFFGTEVKDIHGFNYSSATDIYINATTPPELSKASFNDKIFIESRLHVPSGCKSAYSTSDVWSRFWNIIEDLESGISDLEVDSELRITSQNGVITIENPNGALVQIINLNGEILVESKQSLYKSLTSGVYIIRINGKSQKIKI